MLAAVFRLLIGLQSFLENHQVDLKSSPQYMLKPIRARRNSTGVEEDSIVMTRNTRRARAWQMTVDGPRAAIHTVMICVLYLL